MHNISFMVEVYIQLGLALALLRRYSFTFMYVEFVIRLAFVSDWSLDNGQ